MRKLAGLRVTNGLKQSDVANKIGVSQGTCLTLGKRQS